MATKNLEFANISACKISIIGNNLSNFEIISQNVPWVTLFKNCLPNFDLSINMAVVNQGPSSPTILKNTLCLILQIVLVLEAFECNTPSDSLNHTVEPIRSCVTFKFTNHGEKDKECS